jgi:hypothetical protein
MRINVVQPILSLAILLSLGHAAPSQAVEAFSNPAGEIQWSKVVGDLAEGPTVYDRNDGVFSSWSKTAIRFTYSYSYAVPDGYTTENYEEQVYDGQDEQTGNARYRTENRQREVPLYRYETSNDVPTSLQFSIGGKDFTYTSGPVSPELATALANAPNRKLRLKLVWGNGKTSKAVIGKNTVRAWKQVFQ